MSEAFKAPKGLEQATAAALANGWHFMVQHGRDTGESSFVSLEARRNGSKPVRLVWHTRDTGSYRLFASIVGGGLAARDVSLAKAIATLEEAVA